MLSLPSDDSLPQVLRIYVSNYFIKFHLLFVYFNNFRVFLEQILLLIFVYSHHLWKFGFTIVF